MDIENFGKYLPTIKKPTYKVSFNKKLVWTGLVLLTYFLLSSQLFGHVYGVSPAIVQQFQTFQMLFGSTFGTLMTLGIGPLVTSSIVLQLLVGSKIINWDLSQPEQKRKYEIVNKLAVISLCFIEGAAYVIAGTVPPINQAPFTIAIVVMQLALGGLIVMMLDEIIQKYGIGSGISLFIAAGVANTIFIQFFSPCIAGAAGCMLPIPGTEPIGKIWAVMFHAVNQNFNLIIPSLIPIISTVVVFFIIIYAQGISIDLPLTFSAVRGFGRRWSLKLFYTSNIPVILAVALISQLQLMGTIVSQPTIDDPNISCGLLGCYTQVPGQGNMPTSGLVYYLSAPHGVFLDVIKLQVEGRMILRIFTYTMYMIICSVVFSIFWMKTSGMDPESIAGQISSTGLQIPGYRRSPKILKKVLDRYIPPLAVLGGASIGFLAALADFIGALGTGTGILLTVTIIYDLHERIKNENLENAHPIIKKIMR